MKLFGLDISRQSFGPYSEGWWGIQFSKQEDPYGFRRPSMGYRYIGWLTLSLGTRKAWDGYQYISGVNRAYGLIFKWGKVLEYIPNLDEEEIDCDK